MPKLAQNPETGETLALVGGQWQPAKIAQNEKGQRLVLGDNGWEPMPGPDRSAGAQAVRAGGVFAKGFNDSLAETVGALPDLLGRGIRAVGIPYPGQNGDVTAMPKRGMGAAGNALAAPVNAGLNAVGVNPADLGTTAPENDFERFAQGAGRGVADAASVAVPAGMVARGARAGSVTQGVASALAAQPVTQAVAGAVGGGVGEYTDNSLLGTAAAIATPAIVAGGRRAFSPTTMQLNPEEARRAAMARNMGVQLTPGQESGSRFLQNVESGLTQLPFSGPRQAAVYDQQRTAFNRAALGRAGINADRASPEVLDRAFTDIGRRFDDLAARTVVSADNQFVADVNKVAQEYGRRLPTDVAPVFQSYMDDLKPLIDAVANNQNPQIDGRTFQNISSQIAARARQSGNNPALRDALNGLRGALDDAMERGAALGANPNTPRLPGAGGQANTLADEWRETRRQYRNLMMIDEAAGAGTQADRAAGNLPFSGIRTAVDRSDPRGYARGRGEMADLAQVADFLAQKIPNSGTAERSSAMRMLQGGGMFSGTGVAGMGVGVDPLTAALAGATSVALPPVVQRFMNSPAGRAYIMNQKFTGRGPQMNRALAAALLGADAKGELLAAP